jgi:hypothetical protein
VNRPHGLDQPELHNIFAKTDLGAYIVLSDFTVLHPYLAVLLMVSGLFQVFPCPILFGLLQPATPLIAPAHN